MSEWFNIVVGQTVTGSRTNFHLISDITVSFIIILPIDSHYLDCVVVRIVKAQTRYTDSTLWRICTNDWYGNSFNRFTGKLHRKSGVSSCLSGISTQRTQNNCFDLIILILQLDRINLAIKCRIFGIFRNNTCDLNLITLRTIRDIIVHSGYNDGNVAIPIIFIKSQNSRWDRAFLGVWWIKSDGNRREWGAF